jgi:hypothetical protein
MMVPEITLTTPALLFPAISLLLVAYTNRFNMITTRIRGMSATYKTAPDRMLMAQIESLRKRIFIIRNMQGFGVLGLFLCVLCMFALFAGEVLLGKIIFGISLMAMLMSLGYSLQEILMSVQALTMELSALEKK